jgi:uncharacterized protein (TIGR02145 family)
MRFLLFAFSLSATAALIACAGTSQNDDGSQESELRKDASADGDGDAKSDARLGAAPGVFTDPRDGQSYKTITFGDRTWLARNLAFATPSGSFCYADDPKSCERDGRLYTFTVARTACAPGWHLGTDDDWKSLETALGMPARDLALEGYSTVRGTNEGTIAKRADGFGVTHGAGFRTDGTYDARDDRTYFWTASTRGADVWRRRVAVADPTIFRFTNPPSSFAISVRCVKD